MRAFEIGVLSALGQLPIPVEGVCYLLFDALDESLSASGLGLVDVLAARLGQILSWLRIVATTRQEPAVLDRLRGLRAFTLAAGDTRNRQDLEEYVAVRLGPGCLLCPATLPRVHRSPCTPEASPAQ